MADQRIKRETLSPISFFALRLRLMRNGRQIGTGTGFLYQHPDVDQYFLVTNYHVATCRDPTDPSVIIKGYPDSPDAIEWMTFQRQDLEPMTGSMSLLGGVSWVEHPQREQGVDFVAIPVDMPDDALCLSNRALPLVNDISVGVGTDLFIVGFPYGYSPIQPLPVYKRGTVASEPLLPHDSLPYFLIDANTAPGMSGSPVFAFEKRLKLLATREEAEALANVSSGQRSALEALASLGSLARQTPHWETDYRLVGIYSSRITGPTGKGGDNGDYGLGKVWRIEALVEAFQAGNIVDHPFPPHPVT